MCVRCLTKEFGERSLKKLSVLFRSSSYPDCLPLGTHRISIGPMQRQTWGVGTAALGDGRVWTGPGEG